MEEKRYVAQINPIDKVKEWIRKTVSQTGINELAADLYTESIKDWYEKLKEHPGISEYEAEPKHEDIKGRQID